LIEIQNQSLILRKTEKKVIIEEKEDVEVIKLPFKSEEIFLSLDE